MHTLKVIETTRNERDVFPGTNHKDESNVIGLFAYNVIPFGHLFLGSRAGNLTTAPPAAEALAGMLNTLTRIFCRNVKRNRLRCTIRTYTI